LRSLGARGLVVVCGRLTGPLSRLPRGVVWNELSTKFSAGVLFTRRTSCLSPYGFETVESVPGIATLSFLVCRLVSSGGEVGWKKLASGALYFCSLASGTCSSDSFSTASSARLSLGRLYLPDEGGGGNKEPKLWKPNPPAASLLLSDEYALTWPSEPREGMLSICVGIFVQGLLEDVGLCCAGFDLYGIFTSLLSPTQQSAERSTITY
jgi:hypothetical protein